MDNVEVDGRSKGPFLQHHQRSVSVEDSGIQAERLRANRFEACGCF
jgi:hypothetical protein